MKQTSLVLAASLLLGVGSAAADPLVLASDAASPLIMDSQTHNWSGFHVGIFGGYLGSNASSELDSVEGGLLEADVANGALPRSVSGSSGGAMFGLQAGYDQQFGSFVLGLEGDIAWVNARGSADFSAIDPGVPGYDIFKGQETITSFHTELDNLATARLRAGVTADRALFYVTGGLAAGHVGNEFQIDLPELGTGFGPWSDSGLLWGYTIGAGMEYAVTEDVTAKLEYLYYDLSDRKVRATDPNFSGQQITYRFLNNGGLVRAGLNFKF